MFKRYKRKQSVEARPYVQGEDLWGVHIAEAAQKAGSPQAGDMIARNPNNQTDQWLIPSNYFRENFDYEGEITGGRVGEPFRR